MLAAKSMLEAFEKEDDYVNHNDDHDFGEVLEAFDDNTTIHQHKFRYLDGKEEFFSFD